MTMLTTEMPRPRIPAVRTRPFAPPHPVTRVTAPATTSIPKSSDQKPVQNDCLGSSVDGVFALNVHRTNSKQQAPPQSPNPQIGHNAPAHCPNNRMDSM